MPLKGDTVYLCLAGYYVLADRHNRIQSVTSHGREWKKYMDKTKNKSIGHHFDPVVFILFLCEKL